MKNKTTYTPGPWYTQNYTDIHAHNGEIVAVVPQSKDNRIDNRHLVEAAPKLLEALEEYRDIQSQIHQESLGTTFMIGSKQLLEDWETNMQAAIAAAKGVS